VQGEDRISAKSLIILGRRMEGRRVFGIAWLALTLAACSETGPSATASAGLRLPTGSGCAGDIGEFRAVLANDRQTGHVNRTVYDRAMAELDRAAAACAAGRDSEAVRLVRATKQRYGYR
jgi:hypothetical protein